MGYLTDTKVNKTKAGEKTVKLGDGTGLFLQVNPTGSKLWRFQDKFLGKMKLMALGAYPEVSLERARERHRAARKLLAKGANPMVQRKEGKQAARTHAVTFEGIFKVWFDWSEKDKAPKHSAQVERRVKADIISAFGEKPCDHVTAADVRDMMLEIDKRGAKDVARRAHETASQIFRYTIAHGKAKRNPAADFRPSDILIQPPVQNFARVTAKDLPALLAAMDGYNGTGVTNVCNEAPGLDVRQNLGVDRGTLV